MVKYMIEFYAADTAEDSDPDPTWQLRGVEFPDWDTGIRRMIRFTEALFRIAPITFMPSAVEEDRIEVLDGDESLGALYLVAGG